VQVSSPQHQVNPAASSYYVSRKVKGAEQFMPSEGQAPREELGSSAGSLRGNGDRNVHTADDGTGEILLDEKAGPISLRMKGTCVERKSEEPIVLQGKDNRTLPSHIREGVSA
jgi:hypothetical protein